MVAARREREDPMLESPAMANIKSQIKRNRQNERRRLRNQAMRSRLKTEARRVGDALETGDQEKAAGELRTASRTIDTAVSTGAMSKRTAARRKARLARRVARTSTPEG
jgi:small subunit ribosomal protein S20